MDLKNIIGQHSKSVALSFKKIGFNAEPTPDKLLLATLLYGDRFVSTLESQIAKDSGYTNFMGPWNDDEPTGSLAQPKTLPTVTVSASRSGSKVANTLRDIIGVVGAGLGAYSAAKNGGTPTGSGSPSYPTNKNRKTDEEKKPTNTMLWVGLALVLVLALLVFNSQNK